MCLCSIKNRVSSRVPLLHFPPPLLGQVTACVALLQNPFLKWLHQEISAFSHFQNAALDLGAPLHCTSPPPLCSLPADFTIRLLNDPACVTSESTELPKCSLLPNPCPPSGGTLNPAKVTEAPLTLESRRPAQTGLRVQRWSSATNQAWKPENPSLIKRLKSQKLRESLL